MSPPVTMALMYHTVHKNDKKMQRYGVSSLRLRNKATNNGYVGNGMGNSSTKNSSPPSDFPPTPAPDDEKDSRNHSQLSLIQWSKSNLSKISSVSTGTWCCSGPTRPRRRSNTVSTQKWAILNRAIGYVIAWGLTWIPTRIMVLLHITSDGFLIFHSILPSARRLQLHRVRIS